MLLAIDAGNTNVVVGVYDGPRRVHLWRAATIRERTADEYAALVTQWLAIEGVDRGAIADVAIATVVPRTLRDLRVFAEHIFHCTALVIGDDGVELGIRVLMDRPAEVGADRLVNAVGAHMVHQGPLIVVDFGTATTFDVIDGDGNYRGGIISPGINLSLDALATATAKLPRIAVEAPPHVIGRDTVGAMQSGIYWGYVGLIDGILGRIRAEFGAPMKAIATGGLAPLFGSATKSIDLVDPDITLRGLVEVYRRNRGSKA